MNSSVFRPLKHPGGKETCQKIKITQNPNDETVVTRSKNKMEDSENSGANTRKMGVKGHNPNGEAQHKRGKKGGLDKGAN